MFLMNLGYFWSHVGVIDQLHGLVFLPSFNDRARLSRASAPECARLLFDPQMYLSELDAAACPTVCSRLASYSWFGANIPEFDSSEMGKKKWDQKVKANIVKTWPGKVVDANKRYSASFDAIDFQMGLGCTHVILPSPMITEREDEADTQAQWLDHGLEAAEDLEVAQPLLASVAVDEQALNDHVFEEGGFLDTITDQIMAREGIDGVYIVIAQTHAEHPFATDSKVLRGYVHLSRAFQRAGCNTVLVNFADVFGKVCIGAGATGFITGQSHSLRRLSLAGMQDATGGKAFPKFYSHICVGEFLTERHLDNIVARKLLRRIRDVTPFSEALIERLMAGGSAAELPQWAESQSNLQVSQRHFLARLTEEGNALRKMSLRNQRTYVSDWLEDAVANALVLTEKMPDEPELCLAPCEVWQALLQG